MELKRCQLVSTIPDVNVLKYIHYRKHLGTLALACGNELDAAVVNGFAHQGIFHMSQSVDELLNTFDQRHPQLASYWDTKNVLRNAITKNKLGT